MTDLASAAARGGIIILFTQVLRLVLMLTSTVVLARLVSPTSFGLIAMVAILASLAEVFRDMGLSTVTLRSTNLTQGQQSNLFWLNVAGGFTLFVVGVASAPLVARFFGQPELTEIVQIVSITFLIGGVAAQFRAQINRDLRFIALAVTDIVPYTAGITISIFLAVNGAEYWALVWQLLTISGITLIASVALARWAPSAPSRSEEMRSLLAFGSAIAGSQLVTFALRNADSIAIGRVWGAHSLGLYDRAYQLMMVPINNVISPLGRVAIPTLARSNATEPRTFGEFARQTHLAIAYLTMGPFLLVAGLSQPAVEVVLGKGWSGAAPILAALAVGGAFRGVGQIANWMYTAAGSAAKFLRIQIVSQLVIVAAMLAGLAAGPTGVAIGHSVGFAIYWLITTMWAGHELGVHTAPFLWDGFRILVIVAIPLSAIGVVASHLSITPAMKLAVGGIGGPAWFVLVVCVLPRLRRDARLVLRIARRSRSSQRGNGEDLA